MGKQFVLWKYGIVLIALLMASPCTANDDRSSSCRANLSALNLSGEWIGFYPGHFDQVIRIVQEGDEVVATKITGDDHVPGGEITWRANLRTGKGEGQVAEQEFRNPCFVPGVLKILSRERIVFEWTGMSKVEFRKDD